MIGYSIDQTMKCAMQLHVDWKKKDFSSYFFIYKILCIIINIIYVYMYIHTYYNLLQIYTNSYHMHQRYSHAGVIYTTCIDMIGCS